MKTDIFYFTIPGDLQYTIINPFYIKFMSSLSQIEDVFGPTEGQEIKKSGVAEIHSSALGN